MQGLCAAELENLRRMQGVRANKPVPELGKDKDKAELAHHQKTEVEVAHPKDKGKVKVELAHRRRIKVELAHPKDKGTVKVELAHHQKIVPGLALFLALFT